MGGLIAWGQKEFFAARDALRLATARRPQGETLGKVRFTRAVVERELQEYATAIEGFDEFLRDLDQYAGLRPLLLGAAQYNRALALQDSGFKAEALAGYEVALSEFRSEGLADYERQCLQNMAWVAGGLELFDLAEQALADAAPLCRSEDGAWRQRLCHVYLAFSRTDWDEALRLGQAIAAEHRSVPTLVQSYNAWILGEIGLVMNKLESAEGLAHIARELAWAHGETRCWQDANALWNKIQQAKQTQKASI